MPYKLQSDNTTNVIKPTLIKIQQKKKDTPQKRKQEQEKAQRAYVERITYQPQLRQGRGRSAYDISVQRQNEQRAQQMLEAEQQARAEEEAKGVAMALISPLLPSRHIGNLLDPNVADVGSYVKGLYNPHNKGIYNINQATRDYADRNPGEAAAFNLGLDIASPFLIGKAASAMPKVGFQQGGLRIGNLVYRAPKGQLNMGVPLPERVSAKSGFKSELDWTPESWFENKGHWYDYTPEDETALARHVPEYHRIEETSKANGTWLKTQEGKQWQGDPRTWVQLMSKDGAIFKSDELPSLRDIYYSGLRHHFNPEYDGKLWTTTPVAIRQSDGTVKYLYNAGYKARQYAGKDINVMQIGIPNNALTYSYEGNGTSWFHLNGKPIKTNDIVDQAFNQGYDRVNINNIIDPGPETVPLNSKFNLYENTLDRSNDIYIPQSDVIINERVPRKMLIGNNGNFNLDDKHLFRELLIPLSLTLSTSKINQ